MVTGSHCAVYAAHLTAKAGVRAAIHHDAGIGLDADRGGILGLDVLQGEGIAAAAVAARSARIGDGHSTLQDGTISAVNDVAARLGVRIGSPTLALARALAEKSS